MFVPQCASVFPDVGCGGALCELGVSPKTPKAAGSKGNMENPGWGGRGTASRHQRGHPPAVTCGRPTGAAWTFSVLSPSPRWSPGPRPSPRGFSCPVPYGPCAALSARSGLVCLLVSLGFSEAGRPAAFQPRHRGADHEHRVSRPAAQPSRPHGTRGPGRAWVTVHSTVLQLRMSFAGRPVPQRSPLHTVSKGARVRVHACVRACVCVRGRRGRAESQTGLTFG